MKLMDEVYEIIRGKNTEIMNREVYKMFPRSMGKVSRLNNEQLQKVIPVLRKAYAK